MVDEYKWRLILDSAENVIFFFKKDVLNAKLKKSSKKI